MNVNDLRDETIYLYFTTDGTDVWKLKSFFDGPSCTLENVETKETSIFGMGGLTAKEFHRIQMPEAAIAKTKCAEVK